MKIKTYLNTLIVMLLLLIFAGAVAAEEARIAVSVFQVNSKEDLGYLQSGLKSLLPPRISLPGKITVVDNSAVRRALSPPQSDYSLEKKNTAYTLTCGKLPPDRQPYQVRRCHQYRRIPV